MTSTASPTVSSYAESFCLVLLTGLFLFFAAGSLLDHSIEHTHPYGFYAMDATTHLAFAHVLSEEGTLRYLPPYMAAGHPDVIAANPPFFYTIAVSFASVSGLPVFDAVVITGLLLLLLSPLVMYLIIRRWNDALALISLPFAFFLLTFPFFSALSWGEYPFLAGILFLLAGAWMLPQLRQRYIPVFFALILAALFLGHASELIVLIGLGVLFVVVQHIFIEKGLRQWIYPLALSASITAVLAFHYYFIFKNTFLKLQLATSFTPIFTAGYPVASLLKDFPVLVVVILGIGILCSLAMLFKLVRKKDPRWYIPFVGLFLLAVTYTNLIGQKRALQMRLLWPVLLMVFFGMAVYYGLTSLRLARNKNIVCVLSVGLALLFVIPGYASAPFSGVIDRFTWESFLWIRENTPADATILFFDGGFYNQHTLLNLAERRAFRVNRDDNIAKIHEEAVPRFLLVHPEVFLDTWLPYRKSMTEFGHYYPENESRYKPASYDVCSFDYLVFVKSNPINDLAAYNVAYANQLIDSGNTLAFDNALVAIIYNEQRGGVCL